MELALLADASTDLPSWMGIVNFGALGLWVGWLTWRENRDSKDKRKHTQALEGITQALMVAVLSLKHGDQSVADLARTIKVASESRGNEDSDR